MATRKVPGGLRPASKVEAPAKAKEAVHEDSKTPAHKTQEPVHRAQEPAHEASKEPTKLDTAKAPAKVTEHVGERAGSGKGEEAPPSKEEQAAAAHDPTHSSRQPIARDSHENSSAAGSVREADVRGVRDRDTHEGSGSGSGSALPAESARDHYTSGFGKGASVHDDQQGGIEQGDLDASLGDKLGGLEGRDAAYEHYTGGFGSGASVHDHHGAAAAGTGLMSEQAGSAFVKVGYEEGEGVSTGKGSKDVGDEYGDGVLGKVAKFYETGGSGSARDETLRGAEDDFYGDAETHESKDGVVTVTKHHDGKVVVENTDNNTRTTQNPDGSTVTQDLTTGKVIDRTDALEDSGDPMEAPPPVLHGPDPVRADIDELHDLYLASKNAGNGGDVDPAESDAGTPVGGAVHDGHTELGGMLGNPGGPDETGGFSTGHAPEDPGNIDMGPDATDPNTVGREEEVDVDPGGETLDSPPPSEDHDVYDDSATTHLPESLIADHVVDDGIPDDVPDHVLDF